MGFSLDTLHWDGDSGIALGLYYILLELARKTWLVLDVLLVVRERASC